MSDAVKPDTSEAAVDRQAQALQEAAVMWRDDAGTIESGIHDPTVMYGPDCARLADGLAEAAALLRTLLAERDALRAERDAAVRERDGWTETARHFSEGSDYYRDLLVRIGQTFGREAQIADDGSDMREVLVAKVPDLVAAMRAQLAEAREALWKRIRHDNECIATECVDPTGGHCGCHDEMQAALREAGHE